MVREEKWRKMRSSRLSFLLRVGVGGMFTEVVTYLTVYLSLLKFSTNSLLFLLKFL